MQVVYFVHDLNDPAVARRRAMLRAGGIDAALVGFWRGAIPSAGSRRDNFPLTQTFDSRLAHRAWTALRHAVAAKKIAERFEGADLFLARNLEMLLIAVATARSMRNPPAIVYEVLDIHRTLLRAGPSGKVLRSIERALMRNVVLLVTSSPAFLKNYFQARQFGCRAVPALIVENKLFAPSHARLSADAVMPGRPWRIGWFGVIRCRRSMEILGALARRRPDLVQIDIRGRMAEPVLETVRTLRQSVPALHAGGTYAPETLGDLYSRVHFNWTIDYFEEGGNSEWLLPNRLYEGGSFNVVPLALTRTETGRWLAEKRIGVRFGSPETELETFLESLTPETYLLLKRACVQAPRNLFAAGQHDCDRLVTALERVADPEALRSFEALYAAA